MAGVSGDRRVFRPEEFVPQGFDIPIIWGGLVGRCTIPLSDTIVFKGTKIELDSTILQDGTVIYDTLSVVDFLNLTGFNAKSIITGLGLQRGDTLDCIVTVNRETFEVVHTISSTGHCITFCTDCRHYGKLKKPDFLD